jgi:hypothetical protein
MSIVSEAVAEIKEFVSTFKADSFFEYPKSTLKFQSAYKQLHSLLIWSLLIDRGDFPEDQYGIHPKEAISDVANAFALTTFSLYKPARVMTRSGIENIVRAVVSSLGGDYQVKSVYTLFDSAIALLSDKPIPRRLVCDLRVIYGELCLTVHSAHQDHVALRIPFEQAFSYEDKQFNLTVDFLSRSSSLINKLMFSVFTELLHSLEHKNRDFVLDSLPKWLKRAVQG